MVRQRVHHSRVRTAAGLMRRSVTVLMTWVLAVDITLDNYQRAVVGRVGKNRCFRGCDNDGAGKDAVDSIFQTATFARRGRCCGRGRSSGSDRWNWNRRNVGTANIVAVDNDLR